jgi:hypothetical protein
LSVVREVCPGIHQRREFRSLGGRSVPNIGIGAGGQKERRGGEEKRLAGSG